MLRMSLSKETLVLQCCHSVLTVVNFPSALAAELVSKPSHEAFTYLDTQHCTYLQQQEESLGLYRSSHPVSVAHYPVSLSLVLLILFWSKHICMDSDPRARYSKCSGTRAVSSCCCSTNKKNKQKYDVSKQLLHVQSHQIHGLKRSR